MKKVLLILLLPVYCTGHTQTWQDTVAQIEKVFERYKPSNPGCQLAISRHSQVVYSRAWGMADLEHTVPLTKESLIEAGSVSKQFTAAAILLLEQQGKLSLQDNVRKYVPELPDYGMTITLRQMMQHTSGLKDWGSIAAIAGWPRTTKTYDNDDALYIISRQKTLNNIPGDEYIYSNSNYNLFAVIVQRVSGMNLADFTRKYIFEPAGMKHTQWRDNYKRVVPGRAIAYAKDNNAYYTEMPNEYVYGNGGLLTTAEDLLIWNQYYLNGKLGSPSLLPKQLELTPFNNGTMNRYAAGLSIDTVRGWLTISHTGATASYRSSLQYIPALGLSIAWISNTSEFDRGPDAASAVRNILVKDISAAPARNNTSYAVPDDKLNTYTGWYRDERTSLGVRLFIKDGKLENSRGGTLVPLSDNTFQLGRNKIQVETGQLRRVLFITPFDTIYHVAVDSAKLDEKNMGDYTGEYYSEEAEARFSIRVKDGKLIAHRDPKTDFTLSPVYKDGFSSPAGDVYFERDKKNRVVTMRVYVGRARNVEFKKQMR